MAGKLSFSLVSPEREVFAGLVDQVDAPGVEGDFGVLADHAPFMTALREGVVTVIDGGSRRQFEVHGGFADVTPAGLTILAEQASEVAAAEISSACHPGRGAAAIRDAPAQQSSSRKARSDCPGAGLNPPGSRFSSSSCPGFFICERVPSRLCASLRPG